MIYVFICNLIFSLTLIYLSFGFAQNDKQNSSNHKKITNKIFLCFLITGLIMLALTIIFLFYNNILLLCTENLILVYFLIFLIIKYK